MTNYVIGIDQGTTGTIVALMNADGETVTSAYRTHQQIYPNDGWVEHNPLELWNNVRDLLQQVMEQSNINVHEIAGIGIANQGESVMAWNRKTGEPLYNALVWQDTRTENDIEALKAHAKYDTEVQQRTGLKLDSYFSASKIRWLLDNVPKAQSLLRDNQLLCGTLDTWLIWNMTKGNSYVTDVSTASRTLLLNIHTLEWDDWLLKIFEIPHDILPTVLASTADFGVISHPELPYKNVPIVANLVDQSAAMIGHGCLSAGQIKATYGTGCFINLNTGSDIVTSNHGLLTMLAWQHDTKTTYGLDGGVFTAAASVNWMRENLDFMSESSDIDAICTNIENSNGALWIPSQIGIGAPYWTRTMRGAWIGLDLTTNRAHLIRALLEGICARVTQIIQAMADETGLSIQHLQVDGGLTHSKTMMQIQSDLLGCPVAVLENPEATVTGVCALTARATNMWASDEIIQRILKISHVYEPKMPEGDRQAFLNKFDRAVMHLKAWHDNE